MKKPWGSIRAPWFVALLAVSLALPMTTALAGKGGGRGGRGSHHAAPRRANAAARPRASSMPHPSNNAIRPHPMAAQGGNNVSSHATNARANAGGVNSHAPNATGLKASALNAGVATRTSGGLATGTSLSTSATRPTNYNYGSGSNARSYHAYGYGHGYRNRSSGRGLGRSQSNNQSLVSRLRSVHSSLARLDHDYQGHRVKAMHSISSAIRMLSHRSRTTGGNGSGNRMLANNNLGNNRNLAANRNGNNGGARRNQNQGQRMTQAQSDSRMSQALRTTQGIQMQMSHQGTNSSGHYAARMHVTRASRELSTALAIR